MAFDGVAGEVLYPSQGLFYFKVADTPLMSAIFRAYNDWLAEFCRTDPARLKGIAMINLDDVEDGTRELERAARLGLSGAMITEYPAEDRRYDQPEYEPFWAAAAALGLPLSLHTATRRQGKIRGAGPGTLRDASSRATKAFYPALLLCDMIFSGVFERHPRLTLAIVEFELAWAPNVLTSMDYTYRERHGEAIYRFKGGMKPSDFFRRNVVLSFQEDAIGIRLRDVMARTEGQCITRPRVTKRLHGASRPLSRYGWLIGRGGSAAPSFCCFYRSPTSRRVRQRNAMPDFGQCRLPLDRRNDLVRPLRRSFDFTTLRMAGPRISTFAVIWRSGAAQYSILAAAPACWRRRWPGNRIVSSSASILPRRCSPWRNAGAGARAYPGCSMTPERPG